MHTDDQPRVLDAERLSGGVIITFDDGKCAVYSSSLLYATLPQAQIVTDEDEEDESSFA